MPEGYDLVSYVVIGDADSFGIDQDSAGIFGKPHELEAPKHASKNAAGVDDKCYEWSSIFLTPRTRQCYLGDIHDLPCEPGNAGQSGSL
eukprot:SAG31_NODE_18570_length_631_cov_1.129699_1_plen_88_part_01